MKKIKENYKKFQIFSSVCAIIMLIILFISVTFSIKKANSKSVNNIILQTELASEYVYVYIEPQCSLPHDTDSSEEDGWIIREYNGVIGVFTSNGVFLKSIDTHIKTLPAADRELLREGISVKTRKELLAIIEDYTG